MVPSYKELIERTDAPSGSSWGLFGPEDEIGTLNFIGQEQRLAAAACVRRGATFNLDLPLDAFPIPPSGHRGVPRHRIFANSPHHRDDVIDNFYLQGSSQVDGLRHFAHPRYGFYNNIASEKVSAGSPTIGVNRYAEHCIFGRGVLLDLDRYLRSKGRNPLDHAAGEAYSVELLDEVDGSRIHRSHWVADSGVTRARRAGRGWEVVLRDGTALRVSATYREEAQRRGWLTRGRSSH